MLREQARPDLDVPVLDLGEPPVESCFFGSGSASASRRYRYAASASSCQWCSKRVEVDLPDTRPRLGGLERRRHGSISQQPVDFCTGNP